ncbi:HDOD domain-containing protein [Dyella sp. ASV21]|jgi:HD-like signal output (HDOD) protein|uniref:HDOD domain-containing protein n=1 Tax=Dyella sp. ASV21 TaxID=2795114 RepID=UPI0018EC2585|nr:HDOD domain-containing protein [Dyella sp. ASV21]
MMGIWGRLFARERASDEPAARPLADASATPPVALMPEEQPHAALAGDELEECFYRFVLNQLVSTSGNTNPSREQALLHRLHELCDDDRFDVRSLPRMPAVLPQLMRAMRNDDLSGAQLADLIKRDPVLVGEVMRVTGSVTYRTAHPVGSLQHAVVLLGQIGLRHVVSSYAMKPILMASAGASGQMVGQRLWDHAERCAHAAVFLSKGQCDPFEAYLAGLVGYAGLGAVARVLDKELDGGPPASSPAFIAGCAALASHITLQAGLYWELPANVLDALAELTTLDQRGISLPLSRVLHAAQRLAMYQLLVEQGLVEADTGYADDPLAQLPSQLLARCQQDLQQNFTPS